MRRFYPDITNTTTMTNHPTCMTCDNWHPYHPLDGWCTWFNAPALSTKTCFEHVPIEIKSAQ
jgi:hypothetical protein